MSTIGVGIHPTVLIGVQRDGGDEFTAIAVLSGLSSKVETPGGTALLLDQHHPPGLGELSSGQPVEIET